MKTKEGQYLFPKGRQLHLRSHCSLLCDCNAVFLWKRNHWFLSSTIFNYKQTPKTHLCNPRPVFHWGASVEARIWSVRPTSQTHFPCLSEKNKWTILENPPFLWVVGVAEDWGGGWVLKRIEPLLPRCWVSTLWWRRLNLGHWVAEAEITDLILI